MSNRSGLDSRSRAKAAVPMDVMGDGKIEFAELLRHHQTQLFGYIYSLVRDLDDADDLFQQTSLVLWDKFAQFDAAKSFISWACGVARYEVLNFLRSRSRNRLYFSDQLNLALVEAQESLEHQQLDERRDALAFEMAECGDPKARDAILRIIQRDRSEEKRARAEKLLERLDAA